MTALRVAAGLLLVLAAGHGLLRLAAGRPPHRAYGPVGAVGLSWLAGVAALGAGTTLAGVLGAPTHPLPLVAPALGLLGAAGLLPRLPGRSAAPGGGPRSGPGSETGSGTGGPGPGAAGLRLGDAIAAAVAVAVTVRVAALGAGIPVRSNDEYAMWMLRARALTEFGRLDPRVFTDTGAGYQHQNYPLFLPSLVSWLDRWAGRPSDAAAHLAVALLLGALLAVTGTALGRLAGPAAATAALLVVVSLPTVLAQQSLLLLADLPVFAFALGLALVLLRWLALPAGDPRGRPWLAAAAVLGAGAAGTKSEGLAFAGVSFAAALLLAAGRRRAVAAAGAAALAANVPWLAYVQVHGLRDTILNAQTLSPGHVREVLPWAGPVVRAMAAQWPGGAGPGLVLLAAAAPAAVLAVRAGAGRLVLFLGVVVTLDAAVLFTQYLISAYGPPSDPVAAALQDGLLRVTVYRVALVPAALLALAVPVLAALALRPAPTPGAARTPAGGIPVGSPG